MKNLSIALKEHSGERYGLVKRLTTLCVAIWALAGTSSAAPPPGLELSLSSGQLTLILTGTTGVIYSIQSANALPLNFWADRTLFRSQGVSFAWTEPSSPNIGPEFYRAVSVLPPSDTNLVFIQPGVFTMGSPDFGENPQTVVRISRGFWMGRHAVTQREYLGVTGNNPSYFTTNNGFPEDLSRPVEQVSWDDANNYCAALTQQDLAEGRIPPNCEYRLPTEAEYEYAYRAGTTTRFPYGDDLNYISLTNYEWFSANSGGMTHPVGQKLPNPWGLFDMGGNVASWCHDWHAYFPGGMVTDPQGPAVGVYNQSGPGSPPFHVARCTSWVGDPYTCRPAFRAYYDPGDGDSGLGLRVVLAQSH